MHIYSLTSEVEKACREKRRVRTEAQLSLRSTSRVEPKTKCRLWVKPFGVKLCWVFCAVLYHRGRFIKTGSESYVLFCLRKNDN